jgi:uncharacterized protein (DUF2141 family)
MLKRNLLLYVLIISALLTGCAKRGAITGGEKDTIPPIMVSSTPANMTTNFTGKEIRIDFDEYIKVKDINKQLIISPPLKYQPEIIPMGSASKFISIKIKDTLPENTTYNFNFGQSITDNNEGNPYTQFRFVFSTGSYIDSLRVQGEIKDAHDTKTDNFVTVMLYEANEKFNDSTIYKEKPVYVTNTLDSIKIFSIQNIKQGKYHLFAMKDVAKNYVYNPKSDKLAFLGAPLNVPNDTLFRLDLFKEKLAFKSFKPSNESSNRLLLPYEGSGAKDIKVRVKNAVNNEDIRSRVTALKNKDSLQLWLPRGIKDSIKVMVDQPGGEKSYTVKYKEMKAADSLTVDAVQKGGLHFRERFTITTTTPLESIDLSKITLVNKDSVAVPFTHTRDDFNHKVVFDFEKNENEKYRMTMMPGALTDFYGKQNDTLNYKLSTRAYTDYGNMYVKLKNVKRFPVILELISDKGEILASAYSEKETQLDFKLLEPRKYILRLIYDDNKNGEWDTGDYQKKIQPEEVIYKMDEKNPKKIKEVEVRAIWDWEEDIDAGG